jgi:hypothetical protein
MVIRFKMFSEMISAGSAVYMEDANIRKHLYPHIFPFNMISRKVNQVACLLYFPAHRCAGS